MFFLSIVSKALNIVPNKNLVSNIGFNEDSTHTNDPYHPLANMKTYEYQKDKIPSLIKVEGEADLLLFNNVYSPKVRLKKAHWNIPIWIKILFEKALFNIQVKNHRK